MRQIPANGWAAIAVLAVLSVFAFGYWLGARDTLKAALKGFDEAWKKRDEQEAEFIREARNEFLRRPRS